MNARVPVGGRIVRGMPDDDGLDRLPSHELHDLALSRAKRHLDVKFLYRLMQVLPAAEAAAGEYDEMEQDVFHITGHLDDVTEAGKGEVAENLRPLYIEYLRKHGVKAPS